MPRYHTVLFDADNTLFDFTSAEREAISDTLRLLGVAPSEEKISLYSRINDEHWKMLERGEITKEALKIMRFSRYFTAMGITLDATDAARTYEEFLSKRADLIPGAFDVCRALSKALRLYIITNGIKCVQRNRLSSSHIKPYFTDIFISEEIGFEKPHKGFFDAVANKIEGFSQKDTIVVGDSLTSDIKGGIAAGIDTCWFDPKGKEISEAIPYTYRIEALEELVPLLLS